jgi:hypothetical protein
MPRPVEKPDLPATPNFRRKTTVGEKLLHLVVQLQSIHARLHFLQRQRLALAHCIPEPALRFTRASPHDRPRHVAEVAALRVARKDVENDERIRFQRPEPALVW